MAVKRLRPDPEVMMRFEREVQATGAINPQNVVTIFDSGLTPDSAGFIAMEYLEGEHLAQFLEAHAPLLPSVALPLWLQAVRAMAAADGQGIAHREPTRSRSSSRNGVAMPHRNWLGMQRPLNLRSMDASGGLELFEGCR